MFALSYAETAQLALALARTLSPYASKELRGYVETSDVRAILAYSPSLDSPSDYLLESQIKAFFQKNEELDLGVDKEGAAFSAWLDAENLCRETNALLRPSSQHNLMPELVRVLERARRIIRRVLGVAPAISDLDFRFGPGATTSVTKINACPTAKFAAGISCSERLAHSGLLPSILRELPHWTAALDSHWSIDTDDWLIETVSVRVEPGRVAFVPKNWKTYRAVSTEPTLNSMAQQGLRREMERRMARYGIQISDQSVNQQLARKGSIDGSIATVDLSSASDTISTELVRSLLPSDWFFLLDSFRTGTVVVKGRIVNVEKFVSMGNATSFPLETLIFYSLVRSCCPDGTVTAYGDDICCPTEYYPVVERLLAACGFKVNREKSFSSGPFRESCGADYILGVSVRPIFFKTSDILALYALRNQLYARYPEHPGLWELVQKAIPKRLRFFGPARLGDMVLWSDNWRAHRRCKNTQSIGINCLSSKPITRRNIYPGDWVSPLYSVYTRASELSSSVGDDGYPFVTLPGGSVVRTVVYIS